ncbi:MAG: 4Fe-4S dicluster domain-containing protein [Pirellulales bacterium]|nr:4Fe-4S dicluster domain-containing protein [Pirellulales bacterium]
MAIRVQPKLIDELVLYGAEDVQNCYHCGNCSAVCPHTDAVFNFPRKPMRHLQMGLEERLQSSLEPWLCYYCGQCSTQCPRGAEPGETMMSLRRWLTARYDFTGIASLFYRSWKAEVLAIGIVALLTAIGFFTFGFLQGDIHTYDGPDAFLPSSSVHIFDWAMAWVLFALLMMNVIRMWWFTTASRENLRVPVWSYLKHLYLLPLHFFTQKRYGLCEHKGPWRLHLVLVLSYVTMLVLIMFFLHQMQSGPSIVWPAHGFGYLASIGLLITVIYALRGRFKKTQVHMKHSHESDWIFIVMLLLVTVTGIVQHVLHRTGADLPANVAYVAHMMFVVPMLVLEVPFSKWSHLAYRPMAMYLGEVHRDALRHAETVSKEKTMQPVS